MKLINLRNKGGYTFIEIVVSTIIFSLCLIITTNIFLYALKVMEQENEEKYFYEMIFVLDFIEEQINESIGITIYRNNRSSLSVGVYQNEKNNKGNYFY